MRPRPEVGPPVGRAGTKDSSWGVNRASDCRGPPTPLSGPASAVSRSGWPSFRLRHRVLTSHPPEEQPNAPWCSGRLGPVPGLSSVAATLSDVLNEIRDTSDAAHDPAVVHGFWEAEVGLGSREYVYTNQPTMCFLERVIDQDDSGVRENTARIEPIVDSNQPRRTAGEMRNSRQACAPSARIHAGFCVFDCTRGSEGPTRPPPHRRLRRTCVRDRVSTTKRDCRIDSPRRRP